MLHKSFKPAKCKTSLKLATSRIKLMKNKKGVVMNQMKRELAQLLESGQDRAARIRVEHLIREEKMVAAYELIEIYCELIVARLPIIESQKTCPIDLKEAVTSVIFASPRCADIPELLDVKKHFTAKYGKEFITAALELRPNCGVGRMVVEKLSATAPDVQTKVKVLKSIAEEHNIKWDSNSFEEKESKPADDLLNGPSTFQNASQVHAEIPKIRVPDVEAASIHDKHIRPSTSTEPQDTQNFPSTNPGDIKTTTTTTTHPDSRSSGKGDDNTFNPGMQNWNMVYTDARSAAQAAAEYAVRASMAAGAAADLSSRGNIATQYSSESQKPNNHSISHERPGHYAASNLPGEHFANVPVNSNSFHDRNSKLQNEQKGNHLASSSASLRSSKSSIVEETNKAEKESLNSKMDMEKQSVGPKVDDLSRWKSYFKSENVDQFGKSTSGKQNSISSSHSNSISKTDDYNVSNDNHQKFEKDAAKDLFAGVDQESIHKDSAKMAAYDDYSAAFDEFESDDDSHKVDTGPKFDEGESTSYNPSVDRNSATFSSTTVDSWIPVRSTIISPDKSTSAPHFSSANDPHPLFSESLPKSMDHSESDNVPMTSYDSDGPKFDGPKFDSEDELEESTHGRSNDSSLFSPKQNVFSFDPEPSQGENYGLAGSSFSKRNSGSDRRPGFGSPSSDDLDSVEVHVKNNPVIVPLNVESPEKFDNEGKVRQSSRLSSAYIFNQDNIRATGSPDTLKNDELLNQSSPENEDRMNFGTLRGGFRNKGYKYPPYNRKSSGDASSSSIKKAAEEGPTPIEQHTASPSLRSSINSSTKNNAEKKSNFSTSVTRSDSDSDSDSDFDDSGEEEVPQKTTSRRQAPNSYKTRKEVNMKSTFAPPVSKYFDSDDDDPKEDIPKKNFPNKAQIGSAFSRRTKASSSSTETGSYSKVQAASGSSASPNSSTERKPSRSHHQPEAPTKLKFQTRPEVQVSTKEQPSSAKQQASKEENIKSSAPPRNSGASGSLQSAKTATIKAEPPSREDSGKRASHVHPKLPDYDSIAAQLQSLRKDRQ